MDAEDRMESAESLIKQLEQITDDTEIQKIIGNVIEILEPIAIGNQDFVNLRETGRELLLNYKEEQNKRFATEGGENKPLASKKKIFITAFIEVFQIFKCGFKYEEIDDYKERSDEL